MKKVLLPLAAACIAAVTITSCTKETKSEVVQNNEIAPEVLAQVRALGFGISTLQKHEDGYLVEGDIVLTPELLRSQASGLYLRVGKEEQYRTTNKVNAGGGRLITVALDSKLAAKPGYKEGLTEMVSRYNAKNLLLKFQVVTSGASITFVNSNGSYLASAGFPTSAGDPHNLVKVNARAIGSSTSSTFVNYLATILAHETGHCIGFRHTDYMDRSYSCGGAYTNEGASSVGAIFIPGTNAEADPESWMLACIGSGKNRPFNANDVTALSYVY
jgi:hypothetical protein